MDTSSPSSSRMLSPIVLLGHGLSLAVNAGLTKDVSIFAGPPGWCLVGFLTAHSVASEAYRVTVLAVVQVALIRSAIAARREQQANRKRRNFNIDAKMVAIAFCVLFSAVVGALLFFGR
jgi:hypothetical protein